MRLISYNIHKGIGGLDRRYNLDRIWRVIEAENPDLICLQEVTFGARRTCYHDQPELLARKFEAGDRYFQQNVNYRTGGYGNLILSRWPFWQRQDISLQLNRRKPRGAQLVVVDTPEGRLLLINWHLGLAGKERVWQADRLLFDSQFISSAHLPTLIVGDFNDWRNALARGPFADHDFEQVTGPPSLYRSFPAFLPLLSLDKAFARGGIVVREVQVVRTPLARRASDHLPLVIDFDLNGGCPPTITEILQSEAACTGLQSELLRQQ
jgi:endonuclease/exonuclease/phosphatase family metal-dependent hydrolase